VRLEWLERIPLLLPREVAYSLKDEAVCRSSVYHRKEGMLLRLVQSRPQGQRPTPTTGRKEGEGGAWLNQ
jgi:hypothetical protein